VADPSPITEWLSKGAKEAVADVKEGAAKGMDLEDEGRGSRPVNGDNRQSAGV
jgi:hypothetical protein